jgi:hypothetical protein
MFQKRTCTHGLFLASTAEQLYHQLHITSSNFSFGKTAEVLEDHGGTQRGEKKKAQRSEGHRWV